jgi:hypothetical protein
MPEGVTAYQAHREGIRKLCEWEDNDFDRERYERLMRLFDDRKRHERNRPQPRAPESRRVPDRPTRGSGAEVGQVAA